MKTFLIVIVLALIGLGWWFVFSNSNEEIPDNDTNEKILNEEITNTDETTGSGTKPEENVSVGKTEHVVTYTNQGFSPKTLEIKFGETVVFKNDGERDNMWVASDVHPTHTIYPEKTDSDCLGSSFDACEGISAGEAWSFIFTQKGLWDFHNHMQTSHGGTITVK